jgi:hypothetical protein
MPMTRAVQRRARGLGAAAAALVATCVLTAAAQAATDVYPAGGSGFDGGSEGWTPGGASCSPGPLLCSEEAAYDGTAGNPPGSISARTTATANAVSLFSGTAVWNSPSFTVGGGPVTDVRLRLERAFSPGALVDVRPVATYTVALLDLTSGQQQTLLTETVDSYDTAFSPREAPASISVGHAYRLSIQATTTQSVLAASVITGTTDMRFDNVGLAVQSLAAQGGGTAARNGGGAKSGAAGSATRGAGTPLSSSRLRLLVRATGARLAAVRGSRLYVRLHCPHKAGRRCRITAQGMIGRHRATNKRRVKLRSGRTKRVALRVKGKFRKRVAKRTHLRFRERVVAGRAHATLHRRLYLLRR